MVDWADDGEIEIAIRDAAQFIGAHCRDCGKATLRLPACDQVAGEAGIIGNQYNTGIVHRTSITPTAFRLHRSMTAGAWQWRPGSPPHQCSWLLWLFRRAASFPPPAHVRCPARRKGLWARPSCGG